MESLLERAKARYDLVVVDTPPLTAVSDAFPLLGKVDGVIIVGRVGRNRGLSVFSTPAAAEAMALKWPMIGTFIAELKLESEHGFCLADTGQWGHWTLWGRPLQLLDSIADIVHVEA